MTSLMVPENGRWPTNASYNINPTVYQSDAVVSGAPRACSGDMYAGVPTIEPSVL